MGEEGHRIQQEKYTWKSVLKRHMQVWEELRNAPSNHL
jgi:hypothetical protein